MNPSTPVRILRGRSLACSLLLLTGACADSGPPPPSQAEVLCKQWGYAPNDPVCLNTFRSTGRQ